jgi:hypothetical protein
MPPSVSAWVLLAFLAQVSDEQPPPYKPAKTDYGKVLGAWEYTGAWGDPPPAGMKRVAAEIELPSQGRFDLDDIDIFDADSGEWFGSDPWIQRMTPDGQFVDDRDPVVDPKLPYRGVFIWSVKKSVRRVNFGYWGEMLYTRPVTLAASGKIVPNPSLDVVAVDRMEPSVAPQRYVAILQARDWSRSRTPERYGLFSSRADRESAVCRCDAWLEVDAALRPTTVALEKRPYYEKERRFVLEFSCPSPHPPDALNLYGSHTPLPQHTTVTLAPETLRRLAAARKTTLD